ncbi:MAG: hypothetical protein IJ364_03325 [Oscillospiraceae bacterium]|nr:hypothetical protein [Oscillospiraceae bacterium]
MKKIVSILLVLVTVLSMGTMAFADGTTTLTTTVPAATYTLNIPANQTIAFGATSTNIGNVTVTNSSGFASGKNLQVTVNYSEFTAKDISTTIPMSIELTTNRDINDSIVLESGDSVTFRGRATGMVEEQIYLTSWAGAPTTQTAYIDNMIVRIISTDWGKALGGDYTATITFTSEVVVE